MTTATILLALTLGLLRTSSAGLLSSVLSESDVSVLHNGRTMAHLELSEESQPTCSLSIVEESVKDEKLAGLEAINITVVGLDFVTMMEVIEECENLTRVNETLSTRVDEEIADEEIGTLWCGVNDIAESYTSLGPSQELDRCCRVHDFCPHKIKPFSTKSGLFNPSPWTRCDNPSIAHLTDSFRSNCKCEELFHDCLSRVSSQTADSLGRFYFNFLKLKCIDIRHPPRCSQWSKADITEEENFDNTTERTPRCLEYTEDLTKPKILQFIKTDLEY